MKLTYLEAVNLNNALGALSGREVEASDGDRKRVITKPYEIEGRARYAAARTKRALRPLLTAIDEMRADLREKHGIDAADIDQAAAARAFEADMQVFIQTDAELNAHDLQLADLKVHTNQLDPSLIEALLPILVGDL